MKIRYVDKLGLSKDNIARLHVINSIIEEYVNDEYVMTLRQLYYQLVSRDIIPNKQVEYSKLSQLLKKGRMAGVVDWDAIEDRGRKPKIPYYVSGISDALSDTFEQYRLDRMQGQGRYIEVWVEKDALSNVFARVTEKYHIRLMVNKGYSSCSAMHEAYMRFKHFGKGKERHLLYFGDHDPSGKDMVRDIRDRMSEFGLESLTVHNPALDISQIKKYELPENPAKLTDPRAGWYIEKYGYHSWELDALEPKVLVSIIEKSIKELIDLREYSRMVSKEEEQKYIIKDIMDKYDEENQ